MTDRRELVARAIDDLVVTVCEGGIDEVADAVLAALESWPMPDVPDWVQDGNWETDNNGTAVWMHGDFDIKAGGFARMAQGEGPTLAAAIRNALKGEDRDLVECPACYGRGDNRFGPSEAGWTCGECDGLHEITREHASAIRAAMEGEGE